MKSIFSIDSENLKSLRDVCLHFEYSKYGNEKDVELCQVDVYSDFIEEYQPLDMDRLSKTQKEDFLEVGKAWFTAHIEWRHKEYNNDDQEIA